MRVRILLLSLIGCSVLSLRAQQDEQFTQFMYNKLSFNPAYAGALETPTFTVLARQQWMGLEGAPSTQLLSFNVPLSSTGIGLGAGISRHTIGITDRYTFDAAYTYRFNLGVGGRLGIGLSSSVRLLQIRFGQAESTQPREQDPSIPTGTQSKYLPNFGAGIYYSNQTFYLGMSIPRMLQNNIDLADEGTVISREIRHFYLMGGVLLRLTDNVQMQPQALLKYVSGAPFDADVNFAFIFNEKIYAGLSYRLGGSKKNNIGESISGLFGIQLSDKFMFGLSYDATLSELRSYTSGTLEGVLRYSLGGQSRGTDIINPRFF